MNCPVCKTVELNIADRQGIEIDYCPQCRGVWLDRGELDKIIERSGTFVANTADVRVYGEKRKNEQLDDDRYDDDYDERPHNRRNKKGSFLGEIFDIFD